MQVVVDEPNHHWARRPGAVGGMGFEGERSIPSPEPNVRTLGRLAPAIYMTGASCSRALFPSFVSWSFRSVELVQILKCGWVSDLRFPRCHLALWF